MRQSVQGRQVYCRHERHARGGTVSRIVPKVEMVTALRTDVDTVVTEYGVAQVKDLPNQAGRGADQHRGCSFAKNSEQAFKGPIAVKRRHIPRPVLQGR